VNAKKKNAFGTSEQSRSGCPADHGEAEDDRERNATRRLYLISRPFCSEFEHDPGRPCGRGEEAADGFTRGVPGEEEEGGDGSGGPGDQRGPARAPFTGGLIGVATTDSKAALRT